MKNIQFDRKLCEELWDKNVSLRNKCDRINTLVIGNSHLFYGVIPKVFDIPCFNLSVSSIDLFACWALLKKYGENLKNLKTVITCISVFSPGFDLTKTTEKWRCFYHKDLLGIPYDIDANNLEYTSWKQEARNRKTDNDYMGFNDQTGFFGQWNAKDRYVAHLKHFCRDESQLKYLSLINDWCAENKKRFICVITPHRADYVAQSSQSIIRLLKNYVREYAPYAEFYSFFDDPGFKDDDFGDTDHLNKIGAEKFSKILNKIINNKKPNIKKVKLPGYLFYAGLINLPFVRCFVMPGYVRKIRSKIEKYWY